MTEQADPVIVDAFNVMRAGWPWASPSALTRACLDAGRDTGRVHIIVFDGEVPADACTAAHDPHVELVSARPRIADDVIVELVVNMEPAGIRPLVVTSDRGLQERIAGIPHDLTGGGRFARELGIH